MMRDSKYKNILVMIFGVFLLVGILLLFVGLFFFGAPEKSSDIERFVVVRDSSRQEIITKLKNEGFIKNIGAFALIHNGEIFPGAYRLSKEMNAFEIARVLRGESYMKWVVIPEGLRKEEIADILAKDLGWDADEKEEWITVDTERDVDYSEGVYFPDTYLIPIEESTEEIARRLRTKFEGVFTPYAEEAIRQNIKWTTVLKLASIIQREAAGKRDMPLVSGILWNRLLNGMRLEVDATLQYIKGGEEGGWWPSINSSDKQIDSPYNTYKYAGLPPLPISNPGIEAIEATLYPTETDCFYYLHDDGGGIHCSVDYEGHLENIENYLN